MNPDISKFLLQWAFQRFSTKFKIKNNEIILDDCIVKFKDVHSSSKPQDIDFGYRKCQIKYGEPNFSKKKVNGKSIVEFNFDLPRELYDHLTLQHEKNARKDKHGRIRHKHVNSKIAEPSIDILIENVYTVLKESGIKLEKKKFKNKEFAICLTHDIDRLGEDRLLRSKTYAYQSLRNIPHLKIKKALGLIKGVFSGKNNDYQIQSVLDLERKYNADSSWFFLVSRKDSDFDINGQLAKATFQLLKGQEIGLHPSFIPLDQNHIQMEKSILSRHAEINGVRTHYLRGGFPETLVELEKSGFSYDSTFGYIDQYGFRFGTSYPFNVIAGDRILGIKEIPQTLMDTQVKDFKTVTKYLEDTFKILKSTHSVFVVNYHPSRFNIEKYDDLNLKVYEWILKKGKSEGALMTSIEQVMNSIYS
ncbi:MAG: hypothetical protein HYW24_01800 [Candidatus Aenigmarchaeota archaeon]|nr:hypothetical protein [Candidatus Aenigmarchaeota archaeon]